MEVDFSKPLATILRASTYDAHEKAEDSPGAAALLSGKLPCNEYVKYLMMLWYIYDAFEEALDRHAAHPALEPTYNPTLLRRAPALAEDISHLLQVPISSWQSHPIHSDLLLSEPAPLTAYVARIRELSNSADPAPLLAHSYVRYLGDLSGGQTIRRIIARAYGLGEHHGLGLKFYEFKGLTSSGIANQGEMKRIKEWFREGMNAAGNIGIQIKEAVCKEAILAFNLNTELFGVICLAPEPDIKLERREQGARTELKETSRVNRGVLLRLQPHSQPWSSVAQKQGSHWQKYRVLQVVAVAVAVGVVHFVYAEVLAGGRIFVS